MKTQVRWTENEIAILKEHGAKTLLHDLHKLLPSHTPSGIGVKRKRLGIVLEDDYLSRLGQYARSKVDNDDLCKLDQSLTIEDVPAQTLQILLGSILGDGCIKKNGSGGKHRNKWNVRNFVFYEGHKDKQFDYVKWKAEQLSFFFANFYGNNPERPELNTVSHPIFTSLREKFYDAPTASTKSKLPLDVLNRLDILGLMIWYLDDGYLGVTQDGMKAPNVYGKPNPKITAKGYKYEELVALCGNMNERLGLSLYVNKHRHRDGWNNLVVINKENRDTLFPLWRELAKEIELPKCMYYKLNMHNDTLLASEQTYGKVKAA